MKALSISQGADGSRRPIYGVLLAAFFLAVMPIMFASYAQVNTTAGGGLSAAIKTAILADPRSAALSPEQIDAITGSLTQKASAQGMTAQDILWRPMLAHTLDSASAIATAQDNCGNIPSPLCSFNKMLGLGGSDVTLLVWLGAAATILIALVAGIVEVRHWRAMRSEIL